MYIHGYTFQEKKQEDIRNDERSDQPSNALTDEMRQRKLTIFECDRRFMICEIGFVDKQTQYQSFLHDCTNVLAAEGYTKLRATCVP